MNKIAAIRIKGTVNIPGGTSRTLELLRLKKKNNCIIMEDTPQNRGMITSLKDFITYGEIKEETIKKLEKRKTFSGIYTLSPPRKGYGRKGTKMPFSKGGALGDRKEKINDLIERML